ncbi:DNA-binding protein [Burkholderia singularis]|uniref:DNA-binding protein n=1 Tax=Burkholderia singularis TaxID=1503053 RepID=UPI0021140F63|nr:DNA-binding protein [Burkholderia singularis]
MKSTEEMLIQRYSGSPLLTLSQVAEVLDRSPEGLRVTLTRDCELSRRLRPARIKIGRRVLFRTALIARLIAEEIDGGE